MTADDLRRVVIEPARRVGIEVDDALVDAHAQHPAVVGGLYLKSRSDGEAVFAFGGRLADAFLYRVSFAAVGTATTPGTGQVLSWTETSGLVDAIDQIERLRSRVEAAVARLGGTVTPAVGPG
ncbi:hypothetical protein [Cellulomonas dongxiuzhuiae]|uniref:hypothetical protein n=1 Tax=Cellulomonas dongxiuzhuiae TaxID=2819979 RepID=UPI001AAEA08B|nr:hypothetical protein [Cellulomonas dongxiuzhuiae]MBO3088629.1 hypothetical protein [Cellulomonas dongxiuzhuiae]